MLTDEVRKFTDDDFRAAVRLLESSGNDLDRAQWAIRCASTYSKESIAAVDVLARLNGEASFAVQLLIVTDSFRDVLGLPSSKNLPTLEVSEAGPQNAQ